MRFRCLPRTILLASVFGFVVPINGTAQSNELERLKAEKEVLQRELAKQKKARQRALDERRRLTALLARNEAALEEKRRNYLHLIKSLEELRIKYADLAKALRKGGTIVVDEKAPNAKQRRDLARFERGVHLALGLMRDLLARPSLDDDARIAILRTAVRMRSAAAPLRPAIEALPPSQNQKLEAARKKALERMGPAEKPSPEKKRQRL